MQNSSLTILAAAALLLAAPSLPAEDNTGTGGTITYTDASGANPAATPWPGGYVVHTFTSSGTLTIPAPASADYLVVAGGGGGGMRHGGGGGAGGLLAGSTSLAAQSYIITVGGGGAGANSITETLKAGSPSANSVFGAFTAIGGGGGRTYSGSYDGAGGSGGGGSGGGSNPGGGTGISGQGRDGGSGSAGGANGGGGGAGELGGASSSSSGGKGGNGVQSSISGVATYYAGGGGGGGDTSKTGGAGGLGGGGHGGDNGVNTNQTAGTNGTGGGGGGCRSATVTAPGSAGGSGIVIVRYPYDPGTFSIALASPVNGQSLSSAAPVSVTATVFSGTPPTTVKFYLDSNLVSTVNNATYMVTVDFGLLSLGSHSLYATATDGTSATVISATHTFTVEPDTTAPTPNPMTFAVAPGQAGPTSVAMTATTATDAWSPPLEYFFENTVNNTNSGWISGTTWTDTGLTAGTTYGYQVKARDAAGNETAWSGVASALLPLPGQVLQNFELVSAGSISPPPGWSLVIVPGQSGTYNSTTSGLGSNGTGGSSGLGGMLASSYTSFPGVYLVNSGFPSGVDVRWAISGSYDLNMAGSAYGSCAFLFGNIASGLPGTAGSLLEIVNKQSVFNNDPDVIVNGAGTPLVGRPADEKRCNADTWYRVTFTWTPTNGTTGNLSYMVNQYAGGTWQPYYGAGVSGFTFDTPHAYFGFGSMTAPSTIFDNINITANDVTYTFPTPLGAKNFARLKITGP